MEFTPKKQMTPTFNTSRHAPYSTGSRTYTKRFKRRMEQSASPRSSYPGTSPRTNMHKRFLSRTQRIVNLTSKFSAASEEKVSPDKRPSKSGASPQTTKRPFSAVNSVESIKEPTYPLCAAEGDADKFDGKKKTNDENDPYKFCSDDLEVYDKKVKTDVDKENSIFSPPRQGSVKFYPSKKKQVDVSRSRLLADISPEKVEKAYGLNYLSGAEKENVPTEMTTAGEAVALPEPATTLPHLIGFPNYGNTCYLNSVVQALFGLPPFLGDLQVMSSQLSLSPTSLSSGLTQVITARTKGQVAGVKQSLKTVKENLVRVDGTFSGFKMQDANEFLTRILDTIKDEIDRTHMTTPSPDRSVTSSADPLVSKEEESEEEVFGRDTNSRRLSFTSTDNHGSDTKNNDSAKDRRTGVRDLPEECESEGEKTGSSKSVPIGCEATEQLSAASPVQAITPSRGGDQEALPRNPVKDNFEFQLFESYRCLGCSEVEGRKQEYFGLYVNLPEEEEGRHSIQEAVSTYMGADERELKCEKCGHNRSSVVTSVTRLPRILIVQLKRYEYKAEQCESIKRSWRVPVTRWLTLDSYATQDAVGPSLWSTKSGSSVTQRSTKQTTLTVRNLSSELNVCEGRREQEEPQACSLSPTKPPEITLVSSTSDKEDEELQEVMRRSMDDYGGAREEDEIQQAIRLSLQDLGMSYTQENQVQASEAQQGDEESSTASFGEELDSVEGHHHSYRLISVISHFGRTTNTGHYVADVYNSEEDSWFHYDDESVSKIPESVVFAEGRQKNGYIFFYIHKDLFQNIEKKTNPR